MPNKCKFDKAWQGACGLPADETKICYHHKKVKCMKCKKQATRECDVSGSLTCGTPLCDNCICGCQRAWK